MPKFLLLEQKMTSFSMCFCAIPFSIKDRKEKFMVYQVFMIRNESFKQHARINLSPAALGCESEKTDSECICHWQAAKSTKRDCVERLRGISVAQDEVTENQFSQMMQIILGCVYMMRQNKHL